MTEPSGLVSWRGLGWFIARQAGGNRRLWRTDGTAAGTVLVTLPTSVGTGALEVLPGDADLQVAGDRLYFSSRILEDRLFVMADPSSSAVDLGLFGTGGLFSPSQDVLEEFGEANGRLVFTTTSAASGLELWASDGTIAGTQEIFDIWPGAANSSPRFIASDGALQWFTARTPG